MLSSTYDGLLSAVQDFADKVGLLGCVGQRGVLLLASEANRKDVSMVVISSSVPDDPTYEFKNVYVDIVLKPTCFRLKATRD